MKESLFLVSIPNETKFNRTKFLSLPKSEVTHYKNHRFTFKRCRIHVWKEISYAAFKEVRISQILKLMVKKFVKKLVFSVSIPNGTKFNRTEF